MIFKHLNGQFSFYPRIIHRKPWPSPGPFDTLEKAQAEAEKWVNQRDLENFIKQIVTPDPSKVCWGDKLARVDACEAVCEGVEVLWPGMVREMKEMLVGIGNFLSDVYLDVNDDKQEIDEHIMPALRALLAKMEAKNG